jgi:short-subunit dehydrogenase
MDTNFFGIVHGITTFLSDIRAQSGQSAIIITGSKQGITNPPGNPAYNASKAAVKSLAEGLNYELRSTSVSVHLLVPGWTFTGLTKGSTSEKPTGAWTPEQVAEFLYERMGKGPKGSFYIICPDNETSEDTDKKRMLWSQGDIVYDRQPLSRWREEYKDNAAKWMSEEKL